MLLLNGTKLKPFVDTLLEIDKTKYEVTSPFTKVYNCIAWAVHETDRWWSPVPEDEGLSGELYGTVQRFMK